MYTSFRRIFQAAKASALAGNPKQGWRVAPLSSLTDFQYGRMVPPEKKLTSGYPVFSGYGITGYTDEYMFADPTLVVLARGVSGTGEVRISPRFCYITNLSIALLLKDNVYFAYLYEYLAHDNLRSLDSGSAQSMITIENLGRHKIAIPPKELAEQFNLTAKNLFATKEYNDRESKCLNKLLEILFSELSR